MAATDETSELKLSRTFDAPLRAVWDAWADPARQAHWWGPRGFSITTHHKDFRPGGTWIYTMHGPDGKDYPNIAQYLEVRECARLVYDHGATKDTPPTFRVAVNFRESGGKTIMDLTMSLPTPEAAERTRRFIKTAGGDATWDRLAEYLLKETTGQEKFVISRSFDASIERLFKMWVSSEHLARWLPPSGQQMEVIHCDIRPGGIALWRMSGPNGVQFHAQASYLAIERPHRIVYTQQFCDADGRATCHPFAPTWPQTMLTVVDFSAEGPERTRLTITWEPYGATAVEELETFVKGRSGMTTGWTGSLDKLEDWLAQ